MDGEWRPRYGLRKCLKMTLKGEKEKGNLKVKEDFGNGMDRRWSRRETRVIQKWWKNIFHLSHHRMVLA